MMTMKTKNESAQVIAEELERVSDAEDLAMRITLILAQRTADRFVELTEEMPSELVQEMAVHLEEMDADGLVMALQVLFLGCGMADAAAELNMLAVCEAYDDCTGYWFQDAFFDTDAMDWYCVKNWLKEDASSYRSKLH